MLIENKKIAIVGGGPGGLTLARLLQMKGAEVKVYERDAHRNVRVQGATLDLHDDSGLEAIRQAGLMEAFQANFRPGADKIRIVDQNAAILLDEDVNGKDDLLRPEIDRGPLRKILLDSLEPGTVVWNSRFVSMVPRGDAWRLKFENGTEAEADLVIAADGANSKIRPYITPIKPFYSGITMVEGTVYHSETAAPKMHGLLNGGKIFALGDEKTLIVSSKGDGSLVFYTGCKTEEAWHSTSGIDFKNKDQIVYWFQETFLGWDSSWLELFVNADSTFIPRPQYCMPLDQHWNALPNLTMLGDAAHVMPPYAGEGVNMAMLDALQLSIFITNKDYPDLQTSIAAYEDEMRNRFVEIATITLEQTASLHSTHAIKDMMAMFA